MRMLPSALAAGAGGGKDRVRRRGRDAEDTDVDVERMDCARGWRLRPWSDCGCSSSLGLDFGFGFAPGGCFHDALLVWVGL